MNSNNILMWEITSNKFQSFSLLAKNELATHEIQEERREEGFSVKGGV